MPWAPDKICKPLRWPPFSKSSKLPKGEVMSTSVSRQEEAGSTALVRQCGPWQRSHSKFRQSLSHGSADRGSEIDAGAK
ncbi:hypothetical protein FA13DRAFT_1736484 [Coprinellus micaceus]|uniref:Uncharacterized protein n=1 Tax=Coprinellus micaceus TaxID=71717 RepID=A0A4Y7T0C1_COPMI|nr:hypothetical protein FA13DRAFT_1736484 [Coprinellus micaceus]